MGPSESKKTLKTFAWASFLNDFGSDIIYPIWPLFITEVLGANKAILGFIDGLGEAIVSISQAISGYLSDKTHRRKIFIWLGYLCGSLSRLGYAVSSAWPQIVPFRILDRAGKIRSAPRDAIVADLSTAENRGRNFGLLRAADHLGAVCGIVTSILLLKYLGYRTLFKLAAIPSAIGVAIILLLVKEPPSTDKKIYRGLAFRDLSRNFKLFLAASAIFALGSFSYSFLLLYARAFGFETGTVPVLYLVFTGLAFTFSLPFGKLSDRVGRKPVLVLSGVFWGLALLGLVFMEGYGRIIAAVVMYGLHKGAMEPVQKALVAELAPAGYKASVLGGFQMVLGLCALPASFVAGILWDKVGILAPCYFSLGATGVSILLLLCVKEG